MRQASSPPTSSKTSSPSWASGKGFWTAYASPAGSRCSSRAWQISALTCANCGFAVKLDTNGSFPDRLRTLVSQGLVDYVAMDVKNAPERYAETVGVDGLDLARVRESVSFLLEGSVPYEFRTTVVRELHAESDLRSLAEWVAGAEAWFLRAGFIDEESVLGGTGRFHAWEPEELRHILPELQRIVPTAALRGIDP